ncbi:MULTISPECIES: hypothetical protein [unclassified Mesorhizobium]|uniref:hypothetical protein n=1 Tax=unclassified Mesorhizobium TaxID=325217 RepID=UPI000F74CAB7|nr:MULTISPECIES: hypothetical protein [unclassified Mesorhizobium]AZO56461.1 hypothetical protein EJ077_25955 [Mesorhizobium sp. M8A.F.Ca.ET.057.01.1.1]RWE48803.1 MAG: hypothetical protein EOS80_04665 [Mesorhizobium sp.]TJX75637.1 MAG: hypothetical protein E5W21_04420 [Mesorhizobium sp.]
MLSRTLDAHELYVRIGHHLAAIPARMETYSPEKQVWISKAVALVEAVGDLVDMGRINEVAEWYSTHPAIYGPSAWAFFSEHSPAPSLPRQQHLPGRSCPSAVTWMP